MFEMTMFAPLLFSRRRNVHHYGTVLLAVLFLTWVGRGYWSFRQSRLLVAARLAEMKSNPPGFSMDAFRGEQERKSTSNTPRRILVVGLIQSLEQLIENKAVMLSLQELCMLYHHQGQTQHSKSNDDNQVHVRIVYQQAGGGDAAADNGEVVNRLQSQLHQAGCHRVDLVSETLLFNNSEQGTNYWQQRFHDMNRFERLAVLRSLQRQQIIMPTLATTTTTTVSSSSSLNDGNYSNTTHELHGDHYNVIVNFDADILHFPPLAALSQAIETAASANRKNGGAIVCANGYEQWTLPIISTFDVYYDVFASIDHAGKWYYEAYVQAWWAILTFPQATLFFDIIDSSQASSSSSSTFPLELWPMQSCFGGMAVYDYDTWSNEMCDYDRHMIRLHVNSQPNNRNHQQDESWTLSPNYTIDGTISGDACEHVVFQQCLLAASHQREQHPQPYDSDNSNKLLMIGIQPNLFIGRQADTSLLRFVLKAILVIAIVVMALLFMFHRTHRPKPLQLKQRWSL
jgi:hypothetical protein